jgi:plasmid stabilization system protein ParE
MPYRVIYSEAAADVRDKLPAERRALLERGVQVLARDPYTPKSGAATGSGDLRSVNVAHGLVIEYLVHQAEIVIVVVMVLDEILLED